MVLKGDDTLVAPPAGVAGVSRGGSPALATAGTGDVLSGVIAAFLAQGLDPSRRRAPPSGLTPTPAAGRQRRAARGP